MRLKINGDWLDLAGPRSVAALLEARLLPPKRVAVELNGRIVPRARYAETHLSENDALEIVTLVGGG